MKFLSLLFMLAPITLLAEANTAWDGFSLRATALAASSASSEIDVAHYRTDTFGFEFESNPVQWFAWPEIAETYPYAAFGVLAASGHGAVVMPFCWQGPQPTEQAIVSVMLAQFGEEYPSSFVRDEIPIKKDDASGRLLIGLDRVDGREFEYHIRIISNEQCAYTLAGWGTSQGHGVQREIDKLWQDFRVLESASARDGNFPSERESINNAYHLNAIGLHYYTAHAYREAYRFFSQASDQHPTDSDYLTNALRALTEIDAYKEAYVWLMPRIANFPDDQSVKSWDAWLAYQNDNPEKAMRLYGGLFANGFREDNDFSVYANMLADAGAWEKLEQELAAYSSGGVTESLQLLKTGILSRRGRHEEALAVLDEMQAGRPFNADLVYKRIDVYYEMGNPAEVLRLAESLIENGYRSLKSYFYKGDSEFQLRSYLRARESFKIAQTYSPTHTTIQEYLDAINSMLGEDDTSAIDQPIDPVPLPRDMQMLVRKADFARTIDGYGAFYLSQLVGFRFDGGEWLHRTVVMQIKILDDNGIRNFSTLEFDFNPGFEQLFVNALVVRNADGEQVAVGDPDSYYITHADSGYEGSNEQTVHIPVPSLAPGAVIEAIVSKRISVENGEFPLELVYLSDDRPVDYSAVFVSGDIAQIRYESMGVAKPRKKGNTLVWQVAGPPVYRWEPLQPYFDQILPWVYIGTVENSWSTAGSDYLDEIEDKLDVTRTAAQAARLVEGVDGTVRRIELLSAFVQQEVHYEAIEFGRRAYIPKTARETLRDRYGDCKDHAVLLYSMLNANAIPAKLALVNLNQQVLPGLPNIDQFDHMIVAVETENGPMFIDPTDKDLHLGRFSPRSMAGNYALVLGAESELVRIPDYQGVQVGLRVEREIDREADGFLTVIETGYFSGYQAAELRGQLREIETSELQASMQRWIASRYADAELTDFLVENVFDAGKDLIIELQYRLPIDDDGTFDLPGFLEAHYFEHERVADRRFPFEQVFPLRVSSVTALKFADVERLAVLKQKPDSDETRFGNWRKSIDRGPERWIISFDYVASRSRFGPHDYRDFAEFHRKLIASIEQPLVLN
jgi:tetratricopeptide (TPR) repeat protein